MPDHEQVVDALRAVLLFHEGHPWNEAKRRRWLDLTGRSEATTRNLCDTVRDALATVTP